MDIKLELTGEQINQEIIRAISESTIGVELNKHIQEVITEWSKSYKNPIKPLIEQAIRDEILRLLTTVYKDQIQKAVEDVLTPVIVEEITSAAFKSLMEQITKIARGW